MCLGTYQGVSMRVSTAYCAPALSIHFPSCAMYSAFNLVLAAVSPLQVMAVDESLMCSFRILKPADKTKFGFSARPLTPPRKR